ncbi:MAG: argininosuccinate lyase [Bacteroidales bacterium]|nr:argininosuccinate lyase [Bacteroidales bacterium]
MKLWDKGFEIDGRIERFTVGKDRELDLMLAPFDVLGTMAHVRMLASRGLLSTEELSLLLPELQAIYRSAEEGNFVIEEGIEDVHSQVEFLLTQKLGDVGKKVHSGRSRNDQVLVDIKLFIRDRMIRTVGKTVTLFRTLQRRSEEGKDILMPGYTHFQVAMPSSFGLWFGAYAESLVNDLSVLRGAWDVVDRNPLGSAAGYGSSFPLDREMTTRLLGFSGMDVNSVYAQMGRGKTERIVASAYASLAETLSRFAMDCCLFNSQNFGFITLPASLTTGSSIMPHKKNPDVFELIRAKCNRLMAVPGMIRSITSNLPSGYSRDMQETKEVFFPIFDLMDDILDITDFAVSSMELTEGLMDNPLYRNAFSVEAVNREVLAGVPFRDAYKKVGKEIMDGTFSFDGSELAHTHEGSVGNLCNDRVARRMEEVVGSFPLERVRSALDSLQSCK